MPRYGFRRQVSAGVRAPSAAWRCLPGVEVPAEDGLTNHSYRVLPLCRRGTPNDTGEAYTGYHGDRQGDRPPGSVRPPREHGSCRRRWGARSRSHHRGSVVGRFPRGWRGPPASVVGGERSGKNVGAPQGACGVSLRRPCRQGRRGPRGGSAAQRPRRRERRAHGEGAHRQPQPAQAPRARPGRSGPTRPRGGEERRRGQRPAGAGTRGRRDGAGRAARWRGRSLGERAR